MRGVSADIRFGESEVGDAEMAFRVEKEILRLQVAIDDVEIVQVGEAEDDLRSLKLSTILQ